MKKMNQDAMRNTNGGCFHCNQCGWSTWGLDAMYSHLIYAHHSGYHFHWRGACNCYSGCTRRR